MKLIHPALFSIMVSSLVACSGESANDFYAEMNSEAGAGGEGSGASSSGGFGTGGTSTGSGGMSAGGTSGTGTGTNERRVFVLDPDGSNPVTLHALASEVTETDDGFHITGTLTIETAGDPVVVSDADVRLRYDAESGEGLQHLDGSARLPFPNVGLLAGGSLDPAVVATIGYDLGEELSDLAGSGSAIEDDRKYVTFASAEAFEVDLGSVTLASPEADDEDDAPYVLALDPSDPAIFLRGALDGALGESESAGVGISLARSFVVKHEGDKDFEGALTVAGKLDLAALELPLSIDGNTLFDLEVSDTPFFADPRAEIAFRASGELLVRLDAGGHELEISVLEAWVDGGARYRKGNVLYHGTVAAKSNVWSNSLPIENPQALHASGDSSEEGNFLSLEGKLIVAGVDLTDDARASLSADSFKLSGALATAKSKIELTGSVEGAMIELRGETDVRIPLLGPRTEDTLVTDAEICGTEEVTDATLCGLKTVTNGEACGVTTVTDATVCGTTSIKDATLCGTTTVTSASECGTRLATDAAQCGVTVGPCPPPCTSWLQDCNSCTTANTCNVPNTCTIPATCEVPATCDVPNTCQVPATCNRPKTCIVSETHMDLDLGEFRGTAQLLVDEAGLSGTVTGGVECSHADCVRAGEGRVTYEDKIPRACVTVADIGETCVRL